MTGEGTTVPAPGVRVGDGMGVPVVGGGVKVDVGTDVTHVKVDMTCANTADSAALSNSGTGGSKLPALREWRTKSMLMQALFLRVE